MASPRHLRAACAVALSLAVFTARADIVNIRHGTLMADTARPVTAVGLTGVAQTSSESAVDADLTGSLDLLAGTPLGPGILTAYIEGNTTPGTRTITSLFPDANADAGSALDRDGHGRLQVSELFYWYFTGRGEITAGLIDPAGYIDIADVANDETSQFLAASLVNNPTIEFPDYAIGAGYHHHGTGSTPGVTMMLTSSHGLADNPDASYSELIDLSEDGKGVFAALEAYGNLGVGGHWRVGAWGNSADHASLDGDRDDARNYGVFTVLDGYIDGNIIWSARAGWANPEVSKTQAMLSVAAEYNWTDVAAGAGVAQLFLSDRAEGPDQEDQTEAEVYVRFDIDESLSVTPSVQWLHDPEFDSSGQHYDQNVYNGAVRVTYTF